MLDIIIENFNNIFKNISSTKFYINSFNKLINKPKIYGSILFISCLIILYTINYSVNKNDEIESDEEFISPDSFFYKFFKKKIIPHERHGNEINKESVLTNNDNINKIEKNEEFVHKVKYNTIFSIIIIFIFTTLFYFLSYRRNSYYAVNESNNNLKKINNLDDMYKDLIKPLIGLCKFIGYLLLFIIIPIIIISIIYRSYSSHSDNIIKIIVLIINLFILILFLSGIYTLYNNDINNCANKNDESIICNIIYFIFFIPCLIKIFIEYIKKEYNSTTPTILIILCIELILISMLFIIPYIYNIIISSNDNNLLESSDIVYLNNKKNLKTFNELTNYKKIIDKINYENKDDIEIYSKKINNNLSNNNIKFSIISESPDNPLKTNYNIIFDLYINPQDSNVNTKIENNIFNFCNRPAVFYNTMTQEIVFKMIDNNGDIKSIFKTKNFKFQKWNTISINFYDNKIDIFINNKLLKSINNKPIVFVNKDNIIIDDIFIGQENGIEGSIKNIYYYDTIRPIGDIEFLYNRMKPQYNLIKYEDIKGVLKKIINFIKFEQDNNLNIKI